MQVILALYWMSNLLLLLPWGQNEYTSVTITNCCLQMPRQPNNKTCVVAKKADLAKCFNVLTGCIHYLEWSFNYLCRTVLGQWIGASGPSGTPQPSWVEIKIIISLTKEWCVRSE
ncbi:unnamed protein product [Ixodes pacificus]